MHRTLFWKQASTNGYNQVDIRLIRVMVMKQYEKRRLKTKIKTYKILREIDKR